MGIYALIYVGATMMALVATPVMVRIARILNIMDKPGVRKIHAAAIPRIGGAAIVLAMLGMTLPILFWDDFLDQTVRGFEPRVIALFGAGLFMFFLGLIDDIRDMRARVKLLGQIVAAVVVCAFGIRIESIELGERFVLDFGWWSWPLTVFWIIGITNAVNLIDGLDGLAAGIAAVACGVIAVFAIYTDQPVMAVIMVALLGSLTGFLFFNFNPAKIFMGDCGTMFLGFILATSSVLCAAKSSTLVGLALPALALGIPIFDTFFSIIRRVLERRSIFAPDRSHIHHRLLDMGLRHRHVVILMYLVTLMSAGLGMFMMFTRDTGTIIVLVCVLTLLISLFRLVGAVRITESIAILHRNLNLSRRHKEDQRVFDQSCLLMREARDIQAWWQVICETAEPMEFVWMILHVTNRNGSPKTLEWGCPSADLACQNTIRMVVPVRDRRKGPLLRMEFAVHVNGSLEIAGRRIAGFSRLIDEYSLAKVPKSDWEAERNYTIIDRTSASKLDMREQGEPQFQTI
jgi:UDP-GlcNAc:undecaprenyl-phosphate GlcNAc-1-phosphate transferase